MSFTRDLPIPKGKLKEQNKKLS